MKATAAAAVVLVVGASAPLEAARTERCLAEFGRELLRVTAADVKSGLRGEQPSAEIDAERLENRCSSLPAEIGYAGCPGVGGCPQDGDVSVAGFAACVACAARGVARSVSVVTQPATCGNGVVDPPGETCERDDDCSSGAICVPPGTPDQCTCVATERLCGNGIRENVESCDASAGPGGCAPSEICVDCACQCAPNPAGGPKDLTLRVSGAGGDFDLGWTGTMHDSPAAVAGALSFCLTGCDLDIHGTCQATERGTVAGTFGTPVPVLGAGLPLCIVHRHLAGGASSGTIDLASGQVDLRADVISEIYLGFPDLVCPRCTGAAIGDRGVCDSGKYLGRSCTVDSIVRVPETVARDLPVSRDCIPEPAWLLGALPIDLDLTTGTTPVLAGGGSMPCGQHKDDACDAAGCGAPCAGSACVAMTSGGECIHARGGIAQSCCVGKTDQSCFPVGIARTGAATPPVGATAGAWPEPTYPKSAALKLAGVLCVSTTPSVLVDGTVGLPGPAALLLDATVDVGR